MVLLGQLMAFVNNSPTLSTATGHKEGERQKAYSSFFHQGKPVCCSMFQFFHGIGVKRIKNLTKSLKENGLIPRVHGNTNKKPKHAISFLSTEYVVRFLYSFAEQHALLLPGRIPGYSRSNIQLLPSSMSKRLVWRVYSEAAEAVDTVHSVAYTTFCLLWRTPVPSIVVMKPRSDLCWKCQQNSTAIIRSSNACEVEKTATLSAALEHLRIVKIERAFYKSTCEECKASVHAHFITDNQFSPPPISSCLPHNSNEKIKVHYSFDYAQQVHYPSDPLQPGPIYFLTPRKCTVFGVNCEAIPRQENFLTDEAGECGKGANAVVSRLHYFFDHHGLGEKDVYLHADNYVGQNKNNTMIHYLIWRTLTHQHRNVTISFLPVGHTKFSPDWCFGLFKCLYRRTKVGNLHSIATVANKSAECNFAQLVSDEDGSTIVPTLDWTDFFTEHLKKIPGIIKYHHFRMTTSSPGSVFLRIQHDSPEVKLDLWKEPWTPSIEMLPNVIPPHGLSTDRQWYLYEQIRPFCPEEDKDSVCPLPLVPKSSRSRAGTPQFEGQSRTYLEEKDIGAPQAKCQRLCGVCHLPGHNKKTCNK